MFPENKALLGFVDRTNLCAPCVAVIGCTACEAYDLGRYLGRYGSADDCQLTVNLVLVAHLYGPHTSVRLTLFG